MQKVDYESFGKSKRNNYEQEKIIKDPFGKFEDINIQKVIPRKIIKDIKRKKEFIENSLNVMTQFYFDHKDSSIFKTSNKLNNFYDNSSQLVIKLIKRNSKRILKEISQSRELMVLLTQSTIRELSKEEQEKVQFQLLDILKTIPSLAIFMLPGGAILLPIFVKLLPNMMPSAFDDNKVNQTINENEDLI